MIDGTEKTVYNHWDSYPEGLGQNVLNWLRRSLADESATYEAVRNLRPIPDGDPAEEDFAKLAKFHDPTVSTGRDWYALLRHTQGNIDALLRSGLYEDAGDFPRDSLFCEWAYVVDFDKRRFEAYQGFQTRAPTAGRWVGQTGADESGRYHPVQLIGEWGFDELPDDLSDELACSD